LVSSSVPRQPILYSFHGNIEVFCRYFHCFASDSVYGKDPSAPHEEIKNPRVQLTDMPQFKKASVERLRQRRPVILTVPQLCQSRHYRMPFRKILPRIPFRVNTNIDVFSFAGTWPLRSSDRQPRGTEGAVTGDP
jgi:hypothetical protein